MQSQVIKSQSLKTRVLGGGAIACSTLLVYGWAQAAAPGKVVPCAQSGQPGESPAQPCTPVDAAAKSPAILGMAPTQLLEHLPEPLVALWPGGHAWGDRLPEDMEVLYEQLVTQAQSKASAAQFTQAISQISGIPKNSRHYELAYRLQQDWSQELWRQANQQYENAKLDAAQAILAKIPQSSSLHAQSMALKQRWQGQQQSLDRAIAAKRRGDWQAVIQALQTLESTPLHQSLTVQELWQQAITRLYEPDQNLVYVAMADVPVEPASPAAIAPPEAMLGFTTVQ